MTEMSAELQTRSRTGPDVLAATIPPADDFANIPFTTVQSLEDAASILKALFAMGRPSRAFLVSFANPLSIKIMKEDPTYHANLLRMDLLFSDGIAMTAAVRWRTGRHIPRISFDNTSLAPVVLEAASRLGRGLVLVGGRPGVADDAARQIQNAYPELHIRGVLHGYAPLSHLVAEIRTLDAAIVICGMGMPRQEAFLVELAGSGWHGYGFTCGGYLDQLRTRFQYYPKLIDRLNLRWLYRILREPRRIGYRCCVEYQPFFGVLLHELMSS